MKKLMMIVSMCFIVALTGCSNKGEVVNISYEEYQEKKTGKTDTFMLLLSSEDCGHCIEYKENVLDDFLIGEALKVYEINFTDHPDASALIRVEYPDYQGTPTTIVIQKGEVVFEHAGALTTEQLENLIDTYDLSK